MRFLRQRGLHTGVLGGPTVMAMADGLPENVVYMDLPEKMCLIMSPRMWMISKRIQ